jgi:hypothetical protein
MISRTYIPHVHLAFVIAHGHEISCATEIEVEAEFEDTNGSSWEVLVNGL